MTIAGTPAGLAPALRALRLSGILDTLEARLAELDVICAVFGCGVDELLLPELGKVPQPKPEGTGQPAATAARTVTPRARGGRSLPPRRRPHGQGEEEDGHRWQLTKDMATRSFTAPRNAPIGHPAGKRRLP
jgi:hypothetical protein